MQLGQHLGGQLHGAEAEKARRIDRIKSHRFALNRISAVAFNCVELHKIAQTKTARCVLWAHATLSLGPQPLLLIRVRSRGKSRERQPGGER